MTLLPANMLRKYFLCFIYFSALLLNPTVCTKTFYKLVGKDVDGSAPDGNVPFLTQSFFSCGSNEDCAKVAKAKDSNDFNEMIGWDTVQEDAVVYEKVNTPKTQDPAWSEWHIVKCSVKCGGGNATFVRYCYSHLPCVGKSSKVENCNTEGCPDLHNCTYSTTALTNGNPPSQGHNSWYPLLNHRPSCHGSDGGAIMTGVVLEKIGADVRYNYSCCDFKDPVCLKSTKETSWDDYGSGNAHFLDRHRMDCGAFGFITSFQLQNSNTQLRYSYTCCELFDSKWKAFMQCFDMATAYVADNTHSIYTLAQIPVQCNAGFSLSSLLLQRQLQTLTDWRFQFRCCKVIY